MLQCSSFQTKPLPKYPTISFSKSSIRLCFLAFILFFQTMFGIGADIPLHHIFLSRIKYTPKDLYESNLQQLFHRLSDTTPRVG